MLLGAGSAGVAIGIATAGVTAPAIGAAIGGTMGLSGAATSAGLAALGGGSLAAGGMGMAGGTLLITATGGVFGAGTGAAVGAQVNEMVRRDLQMEGRKLVSLLILLDRHGHQGACNEAKGRCGGRGQPARTPTET